MSKLKVQMKSKAQMTKYIIRKNLLAFSYLLFICHLDLIIYPQQFVMNQLSTIEFL